MLKEFGDACIILANAKKLREDAENAFYKARSRYVELSRTSTEGIVVGVAYVEFLKVSNEFESARDFVRVAQIDVDTLMRQVNAEYGGLGQEAGGQLVEITGRL